MSDSPNFTPATVVYQGTYKGATVSGRVPVWSLPTAPDETARLLYAVITGRSLHKEGRRINWACGAEDFSAWVPAARRDGGRVTNFLHFTFRIEMNPSQSAPRGVRRHPSDKAPTPAPTFTDDVPEPAFDILSDESGNDARSVVIYRDPVAEETLSWSLCDPDTVDCSHYSQWAIFTTTDGWHWGRDMSSFDPSLYGIGVNPFFE